VKRLITFALALSFVTSRPLCAGTLYDNGAPNGTIDFFTIAPSFGATGNIASDSFTLGSPAVL
jgi:hypothetical protein